MKHKSIPVLEIHVETDPAGTVTLTGEIGSVKMIPFKGTVTGSIFNGIVEPCGVDTQITKQNEVRHMSARYMLKGKDKDAGTATSMWKTTAGSQTAHVRNRLRQSPPLSQIPRHWLRSSTEINLWAKGCAMKTGCVFASMNWETAKDRKSVV